MNSYTFSFTSFSNPMEHHRINYTPIPFPSPPAAMIPSHISLQTLPEATLPQQKLHALKPMLNTHSILLSDQLEILSEWFCNNLRMPNATEKAELGFFKGLAPRQVNDWMSNTRRRLLSRAQAGKNPHSLLEHRIGLAVAASQ
jgi:hypothetical protein